MVSESADKMPINADRATENATNKTKSATDETNTATEPELNRDEKLILSLIKEEPQITQHRRNFMKKQKFH